MTLVPVTQPTGPQLQVAHLDRWVLAAIAVLAVAAILWAGVVRLEYGPRRPLVLFAARVRLRMRPGPGWAGRWELWRAHGRPGGQPGDVPLWL